MLASLIPDAPVFEPKVRPPFPSFEYKVGDIVHIDPAVLEDHEIGNPGFLKQFKDVENVHATVNYIRIPWQYKDETPRREPCIGVNLGRATHYYFPEELALVSRGVNPTAVKELQAKLEDLSAELRAIADV